MIALDTNILVYAHREDSPFHAAATSCLLALGEGPSPWAIPWPCVHEFYTIVTHPRVYRPPTAPEKAIEMIDGLLDSPTLVLIGESQTHWREMRGLLSSGHIVGPNVHDARIAALCLQHGVRELWTADRDYNRFPTLKVVNPLIAA
jgi:toxin-antitoxin system PIN domain toxin